MTYALTVSRSSVPVNTGTAGAATDGALGITTGGTIADAPALTAATTAAVGGSPALAPTPAPALAPAPAPTAPALMGVAEDEYPGYKLTEGATEGVAPIASAVGVGPNEDVEVETLFRVVPALIKGPTFTVGTTEDAVGGAEGTGRTTGWEFIDAIVAAAARVAALTVVAVDATVVGAAVSATAGAAVVGVILAG